MRRLILLSLVALAAARYVDFGREKRDIEYHEWLTDAQKAELKALYESADAAALKKRTMELYELLPADQKKHWNGKYKEMCVAWIKEVATEEENNNYKKWKEEGKMDEITAQYKKLKDRLDEKKRKDVDLWEEECWSLWKDEFPAASRGRRSVMDLAQEKLSFLGEEKIAELKALKESGASDDVIRDKVVSWTLEHWKSKDSTVSTAEFVKKCYGWIKDVTQTEEYEAFEKLHHTDHEACRVKVREFLARLPVEKQAAVEKSLPLCDAIWYKQHQEEHGSHAGHGGDHDHHAHKHHARRHLNTMHIEKFMSWMTKEQKEEIEKMEAGGESYDTLLAKMKTYYDALEGDKKSDVRAQIKNKCAEWVYAKTTETEQQELIGYIQDADKESLMEGLRKPYSRLTEEEQHEVDHTKDICIAVWTTAPDRKRRDHHAHHEEYKEYFSWLTPEQQAEVKVLREAGDHDGVYEKMNEFYDALAGDKRNEATEKLKGACKRFFKDTFGEAAVEEFKQMKESGSSIDEISKKVEEFIGKITDDKKKATASRASVNCKKIFSASRRRRDHHHDHHEEYKEYFSWLTPEQGAEVKALREAGKHDEIYNKVDEYYAALAGEKKTEATEKLKGACKHFFKDTFGEAAVEEIKQLKVAGTSMDDIGKKVDEFIGKITDEKKKATATRASVNCKKIFSASRRRRDHHHDHHEEYKEYFSWLTDAQGAEIKALREAGKHDEIYTKVDEYYSGLEGDKKIEATEKLKGACKHFFKDTFGEAAVEEVKQMKESGSSNDAINSKVTELIDKITDEKKKATAARASVNCKKIFGVSRRRRDHHDEYAAYKQYFTWLTPEQGTEIKALREAGDEEGANKKVHEFYDALAGDKKTEATEKLKGACKHYFKDVFGEAAVSEIKQMKESGTSMDDINKKVGEFLSKITDEKKKATATKASVNCKKLFGASRRRREHDKHAEYKEYFNWMTPEQAKEVKELHESGDDDGAEKKVHEFYAALTGDKKTEATEKLKGACKHFFKDNFGEAAVEEVKQMKESGSSMEEIGKKIEELIGKIPDETKKAKAAKITGNCKKVFGASRRRRHQHTLEEGFTEFLPWMSDEQKSEIKALKDSGAEEKIGEKIMEFFDSVDASKKDEARTKLQAGCRHFLGHLIGDAATAELKAHKESGATTSDMATKLDEIIDKMPEGADKTKALGMSKNCKKVYGVAARKRRYEHSLEQGFADFLPWLSDEQKMELKNLNENGAHEKIGDKVIEYFENLDADKKEEARGKLKTGCRHYLKHVLGSDIAGEIKALYEAGSTPAEIAKKIDELIEKLDDTETKEKAERFSKNCKKVYGIAPSRKRRHEHTLEEGLTEFLPWITDEQKMELKNMKEAGAEDKIGDKVIEYYESVDADKKDEARSKLQAGCRHFLKHLLGDSVAGEMKALHESGSSPADMAKKLDEIIDKMDDAEKKAKAERLSKNCKKVYGVATRKRRHEHSLEEGLTEFLPWITDEQKMELKNMKEAGAEDKIGDKVIEYYESVDADKKDEARSKLQAGCRHYLKHLLGDAVAGEMKALHESGSSPSEMAKKLDEIISKMDDAEKKAKAEKLSKNCRKVYGVVARKRRNTYGEFDERYHQYYNWLEEEQKEELAELKESGEDSAVLQKVSEYFRDLSDAKKEEARGQLKMGCRMRMRDLLGGDKAEEIRKMKDEGASKAEMLEKVGQFVDEMEEGEEKESARRSYRHCASILNRHRRDDGKTFADYTKWLTAHQRQELNAIIRSDSVSSDDIYSKLFEYVDLLQGAERVEAQNQMRGACRLFRNQFLGESQSAKLTHMRQTGKKWGEIERVLDGMLHAIEDESKRRKAKAAMDACKVLYREYIN